jgi:hypothetical protein
LNKIRTFEPHRPASLFDLVVPPAVHNALRLVLFFNSCDWWQRQATEAMENVRESFVLRVESAKLEEEKRAAAADWSVAMGH